MIKFSNYASTLLTQPFMIGDDECHVDEDALHSFPPMDNNLVKEGIFFVVEDVYGRFESCYASGRHAGALTGIRRGLGNTAEKDWDDLANDVRVEIRPSTQVFERFMQHDGDTLNGGWWDGKDSEPFGAPATLASTIVTKHNDGPSSKNPDGLSIGELGVHLDKKTLWVGDRNGVTVPVQGGASNVINVMNEGAIGGPGTTDDTDAIQRATDLAISLKACLFFPAGIYKITRPIEVKHVSDDFALSVYGCGMRATIINAVGVGAWAIFVVDNPKFFSLKNMTLTTTNKSTWGFLRGPQLPTNFGLNPVDPAKGATAVYINGQYSWAQGPFRGSDYVVQLDSVEFSSLDHSQQTGWAFGLALENTGNASISNCVFTGHVRDVSAPAAERTGGQFAITRFGNHGGTEDTLVHGCLSVGFNSLVACRGAANSIELVNNVAEQVSRLFSSSNWDESAWVHMKFVRLAGNVVSSHWGFASIHSAMAASIVGNHFVTIGQNAYIGRDLAPLSRYDLLSVSAYSAIISGNYIAHNDSAGVIAKSTDIYGVRIYDNSTDCIIRGNTIRGPNLGLILEAGSSGCERHGNIYTPNARVVTDTDGKVKDESQDNVKPVGAVTEAFIGKGSDLIPVGGSWTMDFKEKHLLRNEIGCTIDDGYLVMPPGVDRMLVEGFVILLARSDEAEVQLRLLKKKNAGAPGIEISSGHYYGTTRATIVTSRTYITKEDTTPQFNLFVKSAAGAPIQLAGNTTLRITVMGYEE